MEITTQLDGSKALLILEGKLTVQTAEEFSAAIDALPEEVCDLELDLAEVTYIASAGLRALARAKRLVAQRNGSIRLLNPREEVFDVFEITGFAAMFEIER